MVYSCGNIDRKLLRDSLKACSTAFLAGIFDISSCSAAGVAGGRGLELHTAEILHNASLSATTAGGTGLSLSALCAASTTFCALCVLCEAYVLLTSEYRFLKVDGYVYLDILALLRSVTSLS